MKSHPLIKFTWACLCLVLSGTSAGFAASSIDAVYFAQTHVQKAGASYPVLVANRETLIKVHLIEPAQPSAPTVSATLHLNGTSTNIVLSGPATLPASIPDGEGVVQHTADDSFTALIPAAWVAPGLTVDITAGAASTSVTNLDIGAPNKLILTMADIHFFDWKNDDYPAGWDTELGAKLPVSELEVRRADDVLFPELVILPRTIYANDTIYKIPAIRASSTRDYQKQAIAKQVKDSDESPNLIEVSFDGENSAATAWNVALRRAAGRGNSGFSNGYSLYFLNKYNVAGEGVAGGFSGVGTGYSWCAGILLHELGHAFGLPHWGANADYPYKGAMYGIPAPDIYNDTHAGPTWAYHLPTQSFIPCTVQANNAGSKPTGTYKGDPMQGGGVGYQENTYVFNHFSDYSVNRIRTYLENTIVVWNDSLNSYAKWNATDQDYTTLVASNGVNYPIQRDQSVISIIAAVSGASPEVCMVYPPIGPYTAGLIRLFDPSDAADRLYAQTNFAPVGGCDATLRVTQGGVTSDYMIAASYDTSADPLSGPSLFTEGVNLPAADGEVTKVELLLTPDAEDNGLPASPQVLYSWTPANAPGPAAFSVKPTTIDDTSISMTATVATGDSDFNGQMEYYFTETSGNTGGSDSDWQSEPTFVATGLQPDTSYSYTVTVRSGVSKAESGASAAASATTDPTTASETVLTTGGTNSWNTGTWTAGVPASNLPARIDAGVAAQISSAPPTWSGPLTLDNGASLNIQSGGEAVIASISELTLRNASIYDTFGSTRSFASIILDGGGAFDQLGSSDPRLDTRNFDGVISGDGGFSTTGRGLTTYNFNASNTFTGGLVINSDARHTIGLNAPGAAGRGDVTVYKAAVDDEQSAVLKLGANNVFSPTATLRLNGRGWDWITNYEYAYRNTVLDMNEFDATVARLFIDGVEMAPGTYPGTSDQTDWIDGTGTLTVTGNVYNAWVNTYPTITAEAGFAEDPDGDGIDNGMESYFGTAPDSFTPGIQQISMLSGNMQFSHPLNPNLPEDISAQYLWSENLVDFFASGANNPATGLSVNFLPGSPSDGIVNVTVNANGAEAPRLFIKIQVSLTP